MACAWKDWPAWMVLSETAGMTALGEAAALSRGAASPVAPLVGLSPPPPPPAGGRAVLARLGMTAKGMDFVVDIAVAHCDRGDEEAGSRAGGVAGIGRRWGGCWGFNVSIVIKRVGSYAAADEVGAVAAVNVVVAAPAVELAVAAVAVE